MHTYENNTLIVFMLVMASFLMIIEFKFTIYAHTNLKTYHR